MGPIRAPRCYVPLIRFLILALYILFACFYRMLPHLSFFLHFLFTYLLPYLSGSSFLCCSTFLLIGESMLLLC